MKNTDTKRLKWLDDLLPEYAQRLWRMGGDEHTFSLRQQMAEKIRNSVRLAGTGRPLHDYAISASELFGNFKLLAIGGLAQ